MFTGMDWTHRNVAQARVTVTDADLQAKRHKIPTKSCGEFTGNGIKRKPVESE